MSTVLDDMIGNGELRSVTQYSAGHDFVHAPDLRKLQRSRASIRKGPL